MKKLGKFMLGCLGLIAETLIIALFPIISVLLLSYVSYWFTLTFLVSFPLAVYLNSIICDLNCTYKFIEWTFGMEIGE